MGDETCAVDGDGAMCTEVVVFPPYPFLGSVVEDLADVGIGVGAQSVFAEAESGAFTGAVSTAMVESMGCEYVLCGHSERRTVFKDDDAAVNKKVLRVYEDGLKPVLCIGETKEEYEAGLCEDVCKVQLAKDLAGVSKEQAMDLVIAYEPVWAIGTGLVCPSDVAQSVHKTVRAFLAELYDQAVADAVRIQYGGSVTPESVDELMSMPDIDGCLVGGASLVAEKFARICNYVRA
jgi:triosephosphate isomerase